MMAGVIKNGGLVSISFRGKCVNEIIRLCLENGLSYIEWGGDVHCPAGDIQRARELGSLTKNAGLIPYCYGSYFRVGVNPLSDFTAACESAKALGASTVRIWAYNKKYSDCSEQEAEAVEKDAREVFSIAREYGLFVNFEYHRSTLTETIDGALRLINVVGTDNLRVHWQPNPEISEEENLRELSLLPRVDIVHAFAWTFENGNNVRHPLESHQKAWKKYVSLAKEKNPDCIFELEFFKEDSDVQMARDCEALCNMM